MEKCPAPRVYEKDGMTESITLKRPGGCYQGMVNDGRGLPEEARQDFDNETASEETESL
jgi:hypothetical protein